MSKARGNVQKEQDLEEQEKKELELNDQEQEEQGQYKKCLEEKEQNK